jgi:hypothetical protein
VALVANEKPSDIDERRLKLRLLVLLPAIAIGLRLCGFRRCYLFLLRRSRRAASTLNAVPDPAVEAKRIAATVVSVNRRLLPYESRCLLESLVLLWVLRRAGIAAELLLGVRTIMGPFEAHAWVEYEGRVLNDVASVRSIYETFDLASWAAAVGQKGPQAQVT